MNKIKGVSANPGKVIGKVNILLEISEIEKMQQGDILVTKTTNPMFTLAILKAKAIVTDHGGPLCHTAIVAREMNVPCVVGTTNATKILKQGQEITVDGTIGEIFYE